MAIFADWEQTEANAHGEQTEVIVPLGGLDQVPPAEDKLITQALREVAGDRREQDEEPPWDKLKLDREDCRLHIYISTTPNVEEIKRATDRALRAASETIGQNMKRREQEQAEARTEAERRQAEAADLRDAFRQPGT